MYVSQLAASAISRVIKVTQARKERRSIRFRTPGNAKVTFHVRYAGRLVGGNTEQTGPNIKAMFKNLLMCESARKDKETQNSDNLFFTFLSFDSIVSIFLPFLPLPLHFFYHHVFSIHLFQKNKLYFLLCYKSEGRWFDPSWCHWIFSMT